MNQAESARRPPAIPREVIARLQRESREAPYKGPKSISALFHGKRVRAIWSRLEIREPTETFHEYILYVLKRTLGQRWLDTYKRPNESKHVVMRWLYAWSEFVAKALAKERPAGEPASSIATGDTKALLAFADDVYRLQLVRKLPKRLLERLRNPDSFQGARYEVCVAAILIRCGFEIEWSDTKSSGKHCEFVARHRTGDVLAVEAKSRHRPGVLNQPGPMPDLATVGADVKRLFHEALEQDPGDKAFAIFIDLNLPTDPAPAEKKKWFADMRHVIESGPKGSPGSPSPYTLLVVTNYSWHFDADRRAAGSEFVITVPHFPRNALRDPQVLNVLSFAIRDYGHVSNDE